MSTSKNKLSDQTLVRCAMIAAVYTVLCLVLQPFSYGAVQVRVAEAFCLLPVFGAACWQTCWVPPWWMWCLAPPPP